MEMARQEVEMATLRTLSWELRRPSHAIAGRPLLRSLLLVLAIAAGWALLMHSAWVGVMTIGLAIIPLWWTPGERESVQTRFRSTLLLGGLVASVQLFLAVMR